MFFNQAFNFNLLHQSHVIRTWETNKDVPQNLLAYMLYLRTHVFVGRVLRLRRNTHWQKNASFDSLLSRAGLGVILGKGGLFVTPPLDCLTGLTGSSTRAGTGCTDLQLISSGRLPSTDLPKKVYAIFTCFRINNFWRHQSPLSRSAFDWKEISDVLNYSGVLPPYFQEEEERHKASSLLMDIEAAFRGWWCVNRSVSEAV